MGTGWLLLYYTLEVFKWLVIVRAVLSWFVSPYSNNPLVNGVRKLTDPVLRPIAAVLPDLGGIDLSPLVAFFAIQLLQSFLVRTVIF